MRRDLLDVRDTESEDEDRTAGWIGRNWRPYSGSASASSPFASSSCARLLIERSVSGCRSPSAARRPASASRNSGSAAA